MCINRKHFSRSTYTIIVIDQFHKDILFAFNVANNLNDNYSHRTIPGICSRTTVSFKHTKKNIIPAAIGFSEPDIIASIRSKKNNAQILHIHFRLLCISYFSHICQERSRVIY